MGSPLAPAVPASTPVGIGAERRLWPPLLRLVQALCLIHLIFWTITWTVTAPADLSQIAPWQVRQVQTAPAVSLTSPEPARPFKEAGGERLFSDRPGLYRFSLAIDQPADGAGVFVPLLADNALLYVNGALVRGVDGRWSETPNRQGKAGMIWEVPPALLRTGANDLRLLVIRDCCQTYVGAIYAGPAPDVLPVAERAQLTFHGIAIVTALVAGVVLLAALALVPLGLGRGLLAGIILAMLGFGLNAAWAVDTVSGWSRAVDVLAGHVIYVVAMAGLSLMAANWIGEDRATSRVLAAALLAALAVLVCLWLALPWKLFNAVAFWGNTALQLLLWAFVFARLLTPLLLGQVPLQWEIAILSLGPVVGITDGLHAAASGGPIVGYGHLALPLSSLCIVAMIGAGLMRQGWSLFRVAQDANRLLTQRIAAKEAELEATYQALRREEAEATRERERARIMRDVHDGMGGHLLALLMQTRDDSVPRARLQASVQNAIDDLRHLIDSLDSVGDSLDVALMLFRERVGPRVRSAGLDFEWSNQLAKPAGGYSSSAVLSVYRILQEAITNALRHATAGRITVTIEEAGPGALPGCARALAVSVEDSGGGIDPKARPGRGLANMRRRAAELGGHLDICPAAGSGTRVRLVLPDQSDPEPSVTGR